MSAAIRAEAPEERTLREITHDFICGVAQSVEKLKRYGSTSETETDELNDLAGLCDQLIKGRSVQDYLASNLNDGSPCSELILTRVSRILVIGQLCSNMTETIAEENWAQHAMEIDVLKEVVRQTKMDAPEISGET